MVVICHFIHLTALHDAKELKFDEDFFGKCLLLLRKSTKRLQLLKACQDMIEIENQKIVKYYNSTQWLSVGDVITCFLEQWEALKNFL